MTHSKQWWSSACAVVVIAASLSVPGSAAGVAGPVPSAGGAETVAGTVTLITGDQVSLYRSGDAAVRPDQQRPEVRYTSFQQHGDVYVLPSDAMSLVADGQLDRELFNVSALVAASNGEVARDYLPLLVTEPERTGLPSRLAAAGARVTRRLAAAEAVAIRADHADLPALWRELRRSLPGGPERAGGVERAGGAEPAGGPRVWLDRTLQLDLADSAPQVGAPDAWAAGFDGSGVTVAVVDSGVDASHPDLAGAVVGSVNFTDEADQDLAGHGTHVASILAGRGTASGGANRGIAHGASVLSAKVCNRDGACLVSDIIDGMEWATEQGADVVNLSLGGLDSPGVDPLEQAINNLTASEDALFVVAAGNNFRTRTVNTPSTADAALAVGAVDGSDALAEFSSEGPRIDGSALKPDITAPGVDVTAARSQDSFLPGTDYTTLDGTSMATPHVAGTAAILSQRHPTWSPEQLKSTLMGSATPNPALSGFAQGAGRLEVAEALDQTVTAQPPSVSLGLLVRDPLPGETVVRTVTYHNHGATGVTLNLSMDTRGPDGNPAPAGMFALSAGPVLVPAGGDASVTLTAALDLPAAPPGRYTGRITAAGGGVEVTTPFGIELGVKLTITHTGRTGGAPTFYNMVLGQVVGGSLVFVINNAPSPVELWVPRGDYLTQSHIIDAGPGGVDTSILTHPRLEAHTHQTIHVDAQLAQPVTITVPDPAAELWRMEIGASLLVPDEGFFSITGGVGQNETAYTAQLGSSSFHDPAFRAKFTSTQYVPGPAGDERNPPAVYRLGYFVDNQYPTGFARNVTAAELATVDARHVRHVATDSLGFKLAFAEPPDRPFGSGIQSGLPMDLPHDLTEFYHTTGSVGWRTQFSEFQGTAGGGQVPVIQLHSEPVQYSAGSSQVQWWNRPVYAPAYARPTDPITWASRLGNQLIIRTPVFGDGDGHAGFPGSAPLTGRTTLTHNGQTLLDEAFLPFPVGFIVNVPPAFGSYQLATSVDRGGTVELATEVDAEWTFVSGEVGGTFPVRLPLWSVQMTPPLDANNTAPAGQAFEIPLLALPQPSSPASGLDDLTVEFSVDDGLTWQPATVSASGGGYVAALTHPNLTGFVSLRAFADDFSGNSVELEVIRAYRIAP